MDWLRGLVTSIAGTLAGRALPKAVWKRSRVFLEGALKRIQQFWREHRKGVISSMVASLLFAIVTPLWPFCDDAPPPPHPTEKREFLAEALFGGRDGLEQGETYDDLDLFGDRIVGRGSDCDGYVGGHGAWHVRGKKEEDGGVRDDLPFYSLTEGIVAGLNASGVFNEIAIAVTRDKKKVGYTVIYAHASDHAVGMRVGASVWVGRELGSQGREGLTDDEVAAVHVEVREDRGDESWKQPACGATPKLLFGPIDPVEYLYAYLTDQ